MQWLCQIVIHIPESQPSPSFSMCPWLARPSQGKLALFSRHLHPHPWMRTTWISSSPVLKDALHHTQPWTSDRVELPLGHVSYLGTRHTLQVTDSLLCISEGDLCIFQNWMIHYLIGTKQKIIHLFIFNKHFTTPLLDWLRTPGRFCKVEIFMCEETRAGFTIHHNHFDKWCK